MTPRLDSAARFIRATPEQLYQAFATADALVAWLPPPGMSATMLDFDFRPGGHYRMRLSYPADQSGSGKTSADADEIDVKLIQLDTHRRIEQAVVFTSDDPAFAGTMRMSWTFQVDGQGCRVEVQAADVPVGISPEDHQAGLQASLENLAYFVEQHD